MADQDVNVLDALEKAAEGDSETSTEEKETVETTSTTDNGMIPRSRYNEVSTKFQEAQKTWEAERAEIVGKLEEAQKSVSNLSDVAKGADEAQQIVTALRGMARDDKWADLIDTLDKGLQDPTFDPRTVAETATEEKSEEGAETQTGPDYKAELARVRSEVDDRLASQKVDFLAQQAEMVSSAYMKELPEEYSEQDRSNIQELWSNRVDWDAIHENPETLTSKLSESFQDVLKAYPTPGQSQGNEENNNEPGPEPQPSVEEQLQAAVGKDWGALKTVDTPTGKKVEAVVSDEEFEAQFAEVFKKANRR